MRKNDIIELRQKVYTVLAEVQADQENVFFGR